MSKDFILPDIGEGIVECELLKWLVKEGDVIKEDQPVAEVMTDKATVEIPAMHDGVVEKLYYAEGDIAKVHAPLFAMADDGATSEPVERQEKSTTESAEQNTNSNQMGGDIEVFILPDIGEGIVECEIVKWSVSEGDTVEEDQVVVEVMTDKAVVEIPAKHPGTIVKRHYDEGQIAKVHSPLFDIQLAEGVKTNTKTSSTKTASSNDNVNDAATSKATNVSPAAVADDKQGGTYEPPVVSEKPLASPAVRRMAKEQNVDLTRVKGSGKKGRILKQDILAAVDSNTSTVNAQTAETPTQAVTSAPSGNVKLDETVKVRGVQAAMLKQMKASVYTIPHFTVTDELEMDSLIELRASLKPMFEKEGIKLSFMPFFIKALSMALTEFPQINARLSDDETELTYLGSHNIGLAVDSKIGLLVPNIKNVEQKSLKEVAVELNRIIDAAREGKLSNADLTGGSISISNIGAIGGMTATPIINKPDVAIVALGKTQRLPRFDENDNVVAKNIMQLSWSGDHRVIDGATMVKFNNLWMDYLCHPEKMLINLR